MTIIVLTATPGCGKTNHAVWSHIKPAVEAERIVYVYGIPDLKLPHIKITNAQLKTWSDRTPIDPNDPDGIQKLDNFVEGSLIVVDEAAYPWPALQISNPPEYIKYLSQHRKHSLDFLVITQSPKFVHPYVLENADRHIHLSQEWSGSKQYEWSEFCSNPKLKTNRSNAVKKPYRLIKEAFPLYYSASQHLEKPKRSIPKMVYAAIFMVFAIPVMVGLVYARISERVETAQADLQQITEPTKASVIPVSAGQVITADVLREPQSLSMLSDAVDWSEVAACISNATNCVCYGHQAQRLAIFPETCNAAINYGWIVTKKL